MDMKKRIGFGAELTLLELIIVIGLFSVLAALDLQVFAAAQKLRTESDRLAHAVIAAESTAECFKAGITPALYYDESWLPADEADAVYTVIVEESSENGIRSARIAVTDKDGEIFALTAKTLEALQ